MNTDTDVNMFDFLRALALEEALADIMAFLFNFL